jgi:hypothetical protein
LNEISNELIIIFQKIRYHTFFFAPLSVVKSGSQKKDCKKDLSMRPIEGNSRQVNNIKLGSYKKVGDRLLRTWTFSTNFVMFKGQRLKVQVIK